MSVNCNFGHLSEYSLCWHHWDVHRLLVPPTDICFCLLLTGHVTVIPTTYGPLPTRDRQALWGHCPDEDLVRACSFVGINLAFLALCQRSRPLRPLTPEFQFQRATSTHSWGVSVQAAVTKEEVPDLPLGRVTLVSSHFSGGTAP